jgi:hypothetical protein
MAGIGASDMSASSGEPAEDMAGRIVLVVDAATAPGVQEACAELAATLADRAGMPVTVATVPGDCLDAVRPALGRAENARIRELRPAGRAAVLMSAAPFVWRDDGRPDWGGMWESFCELALYGGPPHRGPDNPLRASASTGPDAESDPDMVAEMQRGIWETARLYAEPGEPGWLAVTCDSRTMAAWLCAAIIIENVDARVEEDRLLLPAGPGYRLQDEVKSIITVIAKTHHYWRAHITGDAGGPA